MQIDWFVLTAQIINFLILVFILRQILYKRIIKVMDERERTINAQLEEGANKMREGEEQKAEYARREKEFEEKKNEEMQALKDRLNQEKKESLQSARAEAQKLKEDIEQSIREQKEAFIAMLMKKAGEEVYLTSRKVLRDLADQNMEEQMLKVFLKKLKEKREQVEAQLGPQTVPVITSSFPLTETSQAAVRDVLKEISEGRTLQVRFETTGDSVCGITMDTGTYRTAWNIEHYLKDLKAEYAQVLARQE